MRVVQVPVDDVASVVAVGHRLVPAIRPVHMAGFMTGAIVRLAPLGVVLAHFERVLFDAPVRLRMMKVPVVDEVDVVAVLELGVSTSFAVRVVVVFVFVIVVHDDGVLGS